MKIPYRGGKIFPTARSSDQKFCIQKQNIKASSYSAEAIIIRIVVPFIGLTKQRFRTFLLILVLSLKLKISL